MIRNLFAFILFISMSSFNVATANAAAAIAKVVALSGSPKAGGRSLTAGSDIFEHDKISVGSGNVQILFVDGTKLVLGPGSSLVIEKFLMRGSSAAQKVSINALRGTFRFITGNSAHGAYNIQTANATIGIRGTGFDFWVKGDTGVAVHKGKVKLCNTKNSCVDLAQGCDFGIAQSKGSQELFGQNKSNGLTRKLPYTVDQRPLNTAFRLDTSACKRFIIYGFGNNGNGPPPSKDRKGQSPPPPTLLDESCLDSGNGKCNGTGNKGRGRG